MKKGKEKKMSLGRVVQYMASIAWKQPRKVTSMFFFRIVAVIVPLVIPLYVKELVDTISAFTGSDRQELVGVLLGIVWMILLWEGVHMLAWRVFDYQISTFELKGMKQLYIQALEKLHHHSYRFFTNSFGGTLVKRINKFVRGFEVMIDTFFFELFPIAVSLCLMFVLIFRENELIGYTFAAFMVLYVVIQFFLFKLKLPHELRAHEEDSKLTGVIADTITNHETIAVFASLGREMKRFHQAVETWSTITRKNWRRHIAIHGLNGFLMICFEIVVLYLSVIAWGNNSLSVGAFLLFQLYLMRLLVQIYNISHVFKRLYNAMGEAAEMIEIIDEIPEIQDIKDAEPLIVQDGSIRFEQVSFWYTSSRQIFTTLNMHISAGEKVALVGQSGAGKSTIIKLLFRYFDIQDGSISIDGQNIAHVTQESLRDHISLVPQDPILFHRSLAENIAYGKPDASMDEIIHASKLARCHEFISHLEDGYETMVGERGIKLSGGERQRVAIARAILENKPILVMDEATSSLDSESEKYIQEAIHELIQDKTAIVVAHRLSTIKEMDRILVFEQGKIIEQGSHEDLLNIHDGTYKKLWKIQAE